MDEQTVDEQAGRLVTPTLTVEEAERVSRRARGTASHATVGPAVRLWSRVAEAMDAAIAADPAAGGAGTEVDRLRAAIGVELSHGGLVDEVAQVATTLGALGRTADGGARGSIDRAGDRLDEARAAAIQRLSAALAEVDRLADQAEEDQEAEDGPDPVLAAEVGRLRGERSTVEIVPKGATIAAIDALDFRRLVDDLESFFKDFSGGGPGHSFEEERAANVLEILGQAGWVKDA